MGLWIRGTLSKGAQMKRFTLGLGISAGVALFAPATRGEFVPGHVFVAVAEGESCEMGGQEWIVEIDPVTGENWIFAEASEDNDLCDISGLAFTPDGTKLRLLNEGNYLTGIDGWIVEFDAEGNSETVLDESDGLGSPLGFNGIAYDAIGDFYVLNTIPSEVLRFPADGGEATEFADSDDGVFGWGGISFAPNGDLFYASEVTDEILRIGPDGSSSFFDSLDLGDGGDDPTGIAINDQGSIFVTANSHYDGGIARVYALYRYDDYDPASRQLLAEGFVENAGYFSTPIAFSGDQRELYFAMAASWDIVPGGSVLYTVDPDTGSYSLITTLSALEPSDLYTIPKGIAVYSSPPSNACPGDVNDDGSVDPFDVGDVLSYFGCVVGTGSACDASDTNSDGAVDPLDAGFVLARFGTCYK